MCYVASTLITFDFHTGTVVSDNRATLDAVRQVIATIVASVLTVARDDATVDVAKVNDWPEASRGGLSIDAKICVVFNNHRLDRRCRVVDSDAGLIRCDHAVSDVRTRSDICTQNAIRASIADSENVPARSEMSPRPLSMEA